MKDQDPLLNPKSMDYVPTFDELKLPKRLREKLEMFIEDDAEAEKVQNEYQSYLNDWKLKHREVVRKNEIAIAERKTRKIIAHWFNTLPKEKLFELIEDSRQLCDEIMDRIREGASAEWELNYIEKLRLRVKKNPITVESASIDKVRRFPLYNVSDDSLSGSPYSFYRMWAHVFKSESRHAGHYRTKKRE